jgi:hypothetical protein
LFATAITAIIISPASSALLILAGPRPALLPLLSSGAFGFELKKDSTGEVVRWNGNVEFILDSHAAALLGDEKAFVAVTAAVAALDQAAPGLRVSVRAGETTGAGYDRTGKNQNEIVVPSEWPYDENTIAVTLVTVDSKSHRILDADIAFNAVHRKFKVLSDTGESSGAHDDVQNTLTHELGHAVGLAHNAGEPLAVMYPGARKGEVIKRTLSADDKEGLTSLYPNAASAVNAEEPQVGCSAGAGRSAAFLALFLLPLLFRRSARRAAVAGALAAAVAAPSLALASEPTRDPAAAERSAVVATLEVTATHTRVHPNGKLLYTEVEVSVRRCVKGDCPSRMLLLVPGGKQGDLEQYVEGAPVPEMGSVLGITLLKGANVTAPSLKEASLYRLDQIRDFAAFATGLSKAGLSVELPLPQSSRTQR